MREMKTGRYRKFVGLLSENVYVMGQGDGLVVVDAGVPRGFGLLAGRLRRSGVPPERIRHLLLTHFHFDHAGAAAAIKERSGAAVYALEAEVPYLQGERYVPSVYGRGVLGRATSLLPGAGRIAGSVPPVAVDYACLDGEVLPLLGGMMVLAGPGHTPGSAVYYWREAGVLFSGDVIINSYRFLTRPTNGYSVDYHEAALSVCRIAERLSGEDLTAICPGHGPVVGRDAMGKLLRLRESLEKKVLSRH